MSRVVTVNNAKDMADENKQDADLQSDEQEDAGIEVETPSGDETPNDQKEDPSDKLTPDHPRFKDVLTRAKSAEEKAAELEARLLELETNSHKNTTRDSEDDEELSEEELRSLIKIERELSKRGFVTQDSLRVEKNASTLRKLGEKYDGKAGLPKFDRTEVVAYAKSKGFGDNYEAAYRDMHYDTILEQEALKRAKAPTAPLTEKPTAGAENSGKKRFTREDIGKMNDEEYAKYRSGLLAAIKPS